MPWLISSCPSFLVVLAPPPLPPPLGREGLAPPPLKGGLRGGEEPGQLEMRTTRNEPGQLEMRTTRNELPVGNNKTFFLFQKETATILGELQKETATILGGASKGNCYDTGGLLRGS